MARTTLEAWIPEEYDSNVIRAVNQNSVIESAASRVTMGTDTRNVPRSNGVSVAVVAKGAAYGEDGGTNDGVTMYARKFGLVVRLAEEDLNDELANILTVKKVEWANSYAKIIDNACIGVTAADNAGTVPFTSIYRALSQTNAATSYTANANIFAVGVAYGSVTFTDVGDVVTTQFPHGLSVGDKVIFGTITTTTGVTAGTTYYVNTVLSTTTFTVSATLNGATLALTTNGSAASAQGKAGTVGYNNLNTLVTAHESSDFYDSGRALIIAHPSIKGQLRGILDGNQHPLFVENVRQSDPDTILGYPVQWSLGSRKHATASDSPTGNPLLVIGNRDFMMLGVRSGPESVVIDGRGGASALTDETLLKMRARRGFVIGHEKAFDILEVA